MSELASVRMRGGLVLVLVLVTLDRAILHLAGAEYGKHVLLLEDE